jgi:hypothetical protein
MPAVARRSALPVELLLPEGAGMFAAKGRLTASQRTRNRSGVEAVVSFIGGVVEGWTEGRPPGRKRGGAAAKMTLRFKNASGSMTVALRASSSERLWTLPFRMTPRPSKTGCCGTWQERIVLVHGATKNIVIMIGKQSYPLKAGQGSIDPKTALSYSVTAGKYELTYKIPGQPAKTESLTVRAGETWGVITLPTGESLTNRMWLDPAAGSQVTQMKDDGNLTSAPSRTGRKSYPH